MVQEDRFRGGTVPFGYQVKKQGRLNKKGHEVYEIFVNPKEDEAVRTIFDRYLNYGYGSQRITSYLAEQGITNRSGNQFTNPTIQADSK